MGKKQKTSNVLFKTIFYNVLTVYILGTVALLNGLPHILPVKWSSTLLFTLDYPLALLAPIAAFMIGYFATNSKNKWSRLFDGSVFLACYWWFQILLSGVTLHILKPPLSYGSTVMNILVPNVVPIALLGLYALSIRKSGSLTAAGTRREFMAFTSVLTITAVLFQLIFFLTAFANNDIVFHEFTLNTNVTSLAPIFFIPLVILGYWTLSHIKDPLTQLFFATIAATIYVFSAYAWIHLFGSMPRETWLVISGNIIGLLATLFFLWRMRLSAR